MLFLKYTYLVIFFWSISTNAFPEMRNYKDLQPLDDNEALDISIISMGKDTEFSRPISDYLSISESEQEKLDQCLKEKAKLIFTDNFDSFKKTCMSAFNMNIADAGYILGSELMHGEWIPPNEDQAVKLLMSSAKMGSRESKRLLTNYLTDPIIAINDYQSALEFAKELEKSGYQWDTYRSASLHTAYGTRNEAQEYYEVLIEMATKGNQEASISAALSRIKYGYLHDLTIAKQLFSNADVGSHNKYSFLPVLIDIMEDDLIAARKKLNTCQSLSATCNMLYYKFIVYGIGGPKDLEEANEILERGFEKWPRKTANNYAWEKSIASDAPLFNPSAALKALKYIPERLKQVHYIKDTIAAVYAANNSFEKAIELQSEVLESISTNKPNKRYEGFIQRLNSYKNKKRWIEPNNNEDFIAGIKGFTSTTDTQRELTSI